MQRAFYRSERIEASFKASFCDLGRSLAEFAALGIEASWVAREIGFAHLNSKTIGGMSFALHARSFG